MRYSTADQLSEPCSEKHAREDERLGEPVCPDCYDYAGAVLFKTCAPNCGAASPSPCAGPSPSGRAHWPSPRRPGPGLLRQGRAVSVTTPAAPGLRARALTWGRQLDIRPVTTNGDVTDAKVAAYVAKYATKAAECTGTLDRRLTPADRIADLPVREHARRHIAACLRLGKLSQLKELRLAAWAHMLGFCGHFSTKSRAYSVTLGSLRADRGP